MTPSRPKAWATTAQSLSPVSSTATPPGEDAPKLLEWLMLGSGASSCTEHPPARSITCTETRPSTVRAAPAQQPQARRGRTRSESTQVVIHPTHATPHGNRREAAQQQNRLPIVDSPRSPSPCPRFSHPDTLTFKASSSRPVGLDAVAEDIDSALSRSDGTPTWLAGPELKHDSGAVSPRRS